MTEAGLHGLALSNYFASLQEPELRIDIVRPGWLEQMADTERLLTALEAAPLAPDGTHRRPDRELMAVSLGAGVAVVTGASSGMGECTASALLKRGWTVIAIDRVSPTLHQTEDRFRRVSADVTDRSGLKAALDGALRPGESIALVANVAGVYPPSTLSDYTEALFRHVFDVNVLEHLGRSGH